jgi:hypothetical protein
MHSMISATSACLQMLCAISTSSGIAQPPLAKAAVMTAVMCGGWEMLQGYTPRYSYGAVNAAITLIINGHNRLTYL